MSDIVEFPHRNGATRLVGDPIIPTAEELLSEFGIQVKPRESAIKAVEGYLQGKLHGGTVASTWTSTSGVPGDSAVSKSEFLQIHIQGWKEGDPLVSVVETTVGMGKYEHRVVGATIADPLSGKTLTISSPNLEIPTARVDRSWSGFGVEDVLSTARRLSTPSNYGPVTVTTFGPIPQESKGWGLFRRKGRLL